MPIIKRRLPGGHGFYAGDDATQSQGDAYAARRAQIPDDGGWFISPFSNPTGATAAVTPAINTTFLIMLEAPRAGLRLTEARLTIAGADAGQEIRFALFVYSASPERCFIKIAGTDTLFSTTNTGLLTNNLSKVPAISANAPVFLGYNSTSAAGTMLGYASNGIRPLRSLTISQTIAAGGTLDTLYYRRNLTPSASGNSIPHVVYLSKEAANLL